jgi:hypothetical protein
MEGSWREQEPESRFPVSFGSTVQLLGDGIQMLLGVSKLDDQIGKIARFHQRVMLRSH